LPYAKTKDILSKAHNEGYGVGAFNVNDLEFIQAIVKAAVMENSPAIIEASEGALKYAGDGDVEKGAFILADMVRRYADAVPVPISLHLDHGHDLKHVMAAIKAGFTSVMIDASDKPLEENIRITRQIVEVAHAAGVAVEAELGRLMGIEDNVASAESVLVDPDEAKRFVTETQVDFLAPAVGTSHGAFKFKGEAKIDYDRISKVKELTQLPLVLHGASGVPAQWVELAEKYGADLSGAKGVPDEVLQEAVRRGINKVNTDTDLRIAFLAGLRKHLAENPKEFDPRKYFGEAKDFVTEVVRDRMRVLGSSGKA